MGDVVCCHCGESFTSSPRHKNQIFCMKPSCRKAKKAVWQKHKMETDPDYRFNQKASQKQWAKEHSSYWRQYRLKHPNKAERNRILQAARNRRARGAMGSDEALIAKMDASNPEKFKMLGQFWLVPVIAKMDALKVNILKIPISSQ